MTAQLKAPFPYFGGKSKIANVLWSAFGDVNTFVEPFAGSLAVLLQRPESHKNNREIVNDLDGLLCNFWRAVQSGPDQVAQHAASPICEADLTARHLWLLDQRESLTNKLTSDPHFYDAKAAGWWAWGASNWIGGGWCSGSGPWILHNGEIINKKQIPHLSKGQGVTRQIPHLSGGQGVTRQIPHLSGGKGVHRKIPHLSGAQGRVDFLSEWFGALENRLFSVMILNGDWKRALGNGALDLRKNKITGVFLDPPYTTGSAKYAAGGEGGDLANSVRDWCIKNANIANLRIALCGHDGEHDELLDHGWLKHKWAGAGYAKTDVAKDRAKSETIWFNQNCLDDWQWLY